MNERRYRPKHASPSDPVPAIGIGAGLLLAVIVTAVLLGVARAGGSEITLPEPAPPAPLGTTDPEPPAGSREPTDTEAAEFAASYSPLGAIAKRMVAADTNADGKREIVFAWVVGEIARMDVAAWDGYGYRIVGTGHGGPASEIVDLQIRDATRDKVREIIITQQAGQARSVSIWGWDGNTYVPQTARGGCADGRNTFGVNGAEVGVGTILATCDASPQPQTHAYTWDPRARAWVFKEAKA